MAEDINDLLNKSTPAPEKTSEQAGNEENDTQVQKNASESTKQAQDKGSEETKSSSSDLTPEKVFEYLENNDDQSLAFLSKKLDRDVKSFDDLFVEKEVEKVIEKEAELPEVVSKFRDFVKETGRNSMDDFLRANKDWKSESEEAVVMEHIRQTEGYTKEEAQEFFDLTYKPDEDEVSENELKRNKLKFKSDYRKALSHLEQQREKYALPSEEKTQQRAALEKQTQDAEQFSKGMSEAIQFFNEVKIDDVTLKVDKNEANFDKFKTLDGILDSYKTKDGFDHKSLLRDLYNGQNIDKQARYYHNELHNKYVEEERRGVEHRSSTHSKEEQGNTVDDKAKARNFFYNK